MTKIDATFERLRSSNQKALMPFITAGDPDLEFTEAVIEGFDSLGCSMCEVGFPYSDPIADGPVIQASYTRSLAKGLNVTQIFESLKRVSQKVELPLVGMVSYAIVFRQGVDTFLTKCRDAGLSGLIIPDLLVQDAEELSQQFKAHEINLIPLITPTTDRERAVRIAKAATGFVYYVSVTGITGERKALPEKLINELSWLRGEVEIPVCVGFGISEPEHVKQLAPHCDGLIVGSAFVRRMEKAANQDRGQVLQEVSGFAQSLLNALPASSPSA